MSTNMGYGVAQEEPKAEYGVGVPMVSPMESVEHNPPVDPVVVVTGTGIDADKPVPVEVAYNELLKVKAEVERRFPKDAEKIDLSNVDLRNPASVTDALSNVESLKREAEGRELQGQLCGLLGVGTVAAIGAVAAGGVLNKYGVCGGVAASEPSIIAGLPNNKAITQNIEANQDSGRGRDIKDKRTA